MDERADALAAASELVLAAEAIGREAPGDGVATVGELNVMPNAANIIPGTIEMTVEFRHNASATIQQMVERFMGEVWNMENRRGLIVEDKVILDQQPVAFDTVLVKILQRACRSRGITPVTLASMAGHDAVHLAECARSAMIFVRSPNGKSHCPDEYSNPEDIEIAGNVMLAALDEMDLIRPG